MCKKKHKENPSTYDNEGKEKTLSTSEKKEKAHDSYVCICECGKHFCHSMYEHACMSNSISTSKTE